MAGSPSPSWPVPAIPLLISKLKKTLSFQLNVFVNLILAQFFEGIIGDCFIVAATPSVSQKFRCDVCQVFVGRVQSVFKDGCFLMK